MYIPQSMYIMASLMDYDLLGALFAVSQADPIKPTLQLHCPRLLHTCSNTFTTYGLCNTSVDAI